PPTPTTWAHTTYTIGTPDHAQSLPAHPPAPKYAQHLAHPSYPAHKSCAASPPTLSNVHLSSDFTHPPAPHASMVIDTESRTALTPTLEQRNESSNVLLID